MGWDRKGNIRGPQGEQGPAGPQGPQGDPADLSVAATRFAPGRTDVPADGTRGSLEAAVIGIGSEMAGGHNWFIGGLDNEFLGWAGIDPIVTAAYTGTATLAWGSLDALLNGDTSSWAAFNGGSDPDSTVVLTIEKGPNCPDLSNRSHGRWSAFVLGREPLPSTKIEVRNSAGEWFTFRDFGPPNAAEGTVAIAPVQGCGEAIPPTAIRVTIKTEGRGSNIHIGEIGVIHPSQPFGFHTFVHKSGDDNIYGRKVFHGPVDFTGGTTGAGDLTQAVADGRYVHKSGDRMTGRLDTVDLITHEGSDANAYHNFQTEGGSHFSFHSFGAAARWMQWITPDDFKIVAGDDNGDVWAAGAKTWVQVNKNWMSLRAPVTFDGAGGEAIVNYRGEGTQERFFVRNPGASSEAATNWFFGTGETRRWKQSVTAGNFYIQRFTADGSGGRLALDIANDEYRVTFNQSLDIKDSNGGWVSIAAPGNNIRMTAGTGTQFIVPYNQDGETSRFQMNQRLNIMGKPAARVYSQPTAPAPVEDGDLWVDTSVPAYTPAPLINGWRMYDGYWGVPSYMKDANGFVHLRGLVTNDADSLEPMFYLPVGYRPSVPEIHLAQSAGGFVRIDVRADGAVKVEAWLAGGGRSHISLSSVWFAAF